MKQFVQADSVYSSLLADGDSTYLTLKYGGASKYYAGLYMPSVDILDMAYEQDTTSVEVCLLLGSALGKTYDRKRAYDLFDRAEKGLEPNRFLVNQLLAFRAETYQRMGDTRKRPVSTMRHGRRIRNDWISWRRSRICIVRLTCLNSRARRIASEGFLSWYFI